MPHIRKYGYTHYTWILPSEFIGDHIFTQSGGFAYLHEEPYTKSLYFPVTQKLADVTLPNRGKGGAELHINVGELEKYPLLQVRCRTLARASLHRALALVARDASLHSCALASASKSQPPPGDDSLVLPPQTPPRGLPHRRSRRCTSWSRYR